MRVDASEVEEELYRRVESVLQQVLKTHEGTVTGCYFTFEPAESNS